MKHKTLTTIAIALAIRGVGQPQPQPSPLFNNIPGVTMPAPPKPATLGGVPSFGFPQPQAPSPGFGVTPQIQQQNQMLIQQSMQQGQQRRMQQQQIMAEIENDMKPKTIRYGFPDQSHVAGTEHFRNAFAEIDQMLKGERPLSLKRAVFLTENAYLDNRMEYDWFGHDISNDVEVINALIEQAGYDKGTPTAKKWALQQLMSDTIYFRDGNGNLTHTHLPYQYDFEDPWGKEDWTKQFVLKLTRSGKGQCRSLPLLYLILAEELGVEAWLSYSPSHSYIKVKDGKGNLLNYETTNGYYTTDVWVQSSGYIKAEALRSGIYMDTMSRKEVVAATLADLAKGYAIKYGFDQFVLDCLDKALEYSPNNVYALQLRSDYQTYLFFYVLDQLGRPPVEKLPNYPKAYELFLKMHEIYGQVDAIGFEQMPERVYQKWLQSFETESKKQPVEIIRP
jgi:hypothetical protein